MLETVSPVAPTPVRHVPPVAVDNAVGVVELRQYTLHPGRRETLIRLFESEFIESQEETGMHLLGQFRDLDDPDRFVWLRGFAGMAGRREALARFYQGPVWRRHREAANATMIDSDNVLLLKPLMLDDGLAATPPPPAIGEASERRVVIALHYFDAPVGPDWQEHFDQVQRPWLEGMHARIVATLVSETVPNDYPALPVRTGEHVFACVMEFADEASHERCARQLQAPWRLGSQPRASELLCLAPTARSRLGRSP